VAIAHGLSFLALVAAIVLLKLPAPSWNYLGLAFCAGIAGGAGLAVFYKALSLAPMGLTAALTGLFTALVPVIAGVFAEGAPSLVQILGFVLAAVSIWLVARAPGESAAIRALWLGMLAGLGFGVLLVLLKYASQGGVIWALTTARSASTSIMLSALLLKRGKVVVGRGYLWLGALTGLLDTGGNLLYTLATKVGRMDVAAVLSSLYPAVTILLAVMILKERATRIQLFGMVLALIAVALISG
jgi:drug/metabolite transporter (DMT)-like permease